MANKTKKGYEEHLNSLYADTLSCGDALDHFEHLASELTIENNYNNNTLGTLQRRKDPISFEVGYQDWKR